MRGTRLGYLIFRFVSPLSHGHLHFLLLLFILVSSDLDEGPGNDADPLNGPLGCTTGMPSSKFQPWDLPVPGSVTLECLAGFAAASLRDKTRDTFARIENMDTVKQLAVSKSSRLVEQLPLYLQTLRRKRVDKTRTTVRP